MKEGILIEEIADFYFEPVKLIVKSSAEEAGETISVKGIRAETPSVTGPEYFLQKGLAQNEDFESINSREMLEDSFRKDFEKTKEEVRKKLGGSIPSADIFEIFFSLDPFSLSKAMRILSEGTPRTIYKYEHGDGFVLPNTPSEFLVFGEKEDIVFEIIKTVESKFSELNTITSDFGLELTKFLHGEKYQRRNLEEYKEIEDLEYGSPANQFEKNIIETCAKTTSSFLSNLNVYFKDPDEDFEFDVFIGLGDTFKAIVEPTNYEKVKERIKSQEIGAGNLKSEIILRTKDKVDRLPTTDIEKIIVVTKGFPEEVFKDIKEIAEPRDVVLLNEENYGEQIPQHILEGVFISLGATHSNWRRRIRLNL